VKITAKGAGGGNIDAFPPATGGGGGATMIGTFVINNSERIRAIAGGGGGNASNVAGGGGGGSGAVNCGNPQDCLNGFILILAAGGNGEGFADGTPALSATGDGSPGLGCGSDCGGGGGAPNGNGGSGTGLGSGGGGGVVFLNGISAGGTGGPAGSGNNGGNGMGGGGGGGSDGPGGGGGYAGGDAGDGGTAAQSFNSGTDQNNSDGLPETGPVFGSVLIECLGALPVELINFKALIQNNGGVKLLWSTATEKNNKGYDLERSTDNRTWTALGFIPGNGNSTRQNDYNFTDDNPLPGINYYRLKQMDMDGDIEYSPMVVADVRANGLQLDIFPNPSADGEISIRAVSKQEGNALLEIYDWLGYKVYKEQVYLYEGTMVYPISLATYPKGTYNARLEMPDGQVHFKKIVLQ